MPHTLTFDAMLTREEDRLQGFARRLFLIEAVQDELTRVSREKPFVAWNDVVWMMVLDTRDAFAIHFASWVRSVYEKGGFLRQVQAHHLRALRKKWRECGTARDDEFLRDFLSHHHDESFNRLFPTVSTPFPRSDDVERVRDEFASKFASIVGDRDSHRAHPYEKAHAKNARMLEVHDHRALLHQAQSFLNDLRLVVCRSTFGYSNANFASVKTVAEELVDQILIGTRNRRDVVQGGRDREEFYDELHTRHDKNERDPKPLFNENYDDGKDAA